MQADTKTFSLQVEGNCIVPLSLSACATTLRYIGVA